MGFAETTGIGIDLLMAIVGVFGVVFVAGGKVIDFFISEWKRKREEKSGRDTTLGCASCIEAVKGIRDLLEGDLRRATDARIEDLKAQRDDYKRHNKEMAAAVDRLSRAVKDGFGVFDASDPDGEEEDQDGDE